MYRIVLTARRIAPDTNNPAPGNASIKASKGMAIHAISRLLPIQFEKNSVILFLPLKTFYDA